MVQPSHTLQVLQVALAELETFTRPSRTGCIDFTMTNLGFCQPKCGRIVGFLCCWSVKMVLIWIPSIEIRGNPSEEKQTLTRFFLTNIGNQSCNPQKNWSSKMRMQLVQTANMKVYKRPHITTPKWSRTGNSTWETNIIYTCWMCHCFFWQRARAKWDTAPQLSVLKIQKLNTGNYIEVQGKWARRWLCNH